mgnify:CR=1 FL=1
MSGPSKEWLMAAGDAEDRCVGGPSVGGLAADLRLCPPTPRPHQVAGELAAECGRLRHELRAQREAMGAEIGRLQAFKDYVHKRLDEAGVPTHPEGRPASEGCRIGERLDLVFGRLDECRELLLALVIEGRLDHDQAADLLDKLPKPSAPTEAP